MATDRIFRAMATAGLWLFGACFLIFILAVLIAKGKARNITSRLLWKYEDIFAYTTWRIWGCPFADGCDRHPPITEAIFWESEEYHLDHTLFKIWKPSLVSWQSC